MPAPRPKRTAKPPRQVSRETRTILAFGVAVTVLCAVWLFAFSLRVPLWDASDAVIGRPVALSAAFTGGVSALVNTTLLLTLASCAYLLALWALQRGFRRSFPAVIGASVVACAVLLPMRPLASPDVTHLAADVRTFWLHQRYPASVANAPAFVNDPVAKKVEVYVKEPSGYGPIAYGIGGLALPFVGSSLAANVAGQKAVAAAFLVLTAFGAGLLAKRLGHDPALAAGIVGLNPLMLFQFAGDGHDDSIMAAFGVFAMLLLVQAGWRARSGGIAMGAAAVLSKFALIFAAPVVLTAWFPRWRRWLAAALLVIGIALVVMLLGGAGPKIGTRGPATTISLTTPWTVLSRWLSLGHDGQRTLVAISYAMFVLLTALVLLLHPFKKPADMVAAVALVMWLFLFACSPGELPWYQIWYLPFAAAAGRRWLVAAAIVFTCGGFLPTLALNWNISIDRQMGITNASDKAVLTVWIATGLVALGWWYA
ncbi:MAG: hypothetical protein ACRDG3_06450, partial [Tepidiformaceae bacterium]